MSEENGRSILVSYEHFEHWISASQETQVLPKIECLRKTVNRSSVHAATRGAINN